MYKSVDFQKEQRHPKGKNGADLYTIKTNWFWIFFIYFYI